MVPWSDLTLGRLLGWNLTTRRQPRPGIALYYAVFGFNLFVTAWIGEWKLVMVGTTVHLATG